MSTTRSTRAEVRNPVLALPSAVKLKALSPEAREALREVLGDIALDARERAEKCWRSHKAPMAAYWKAVSVYAGHTRRALRLTAPTVAEELAAMGRLDAADEARRDEVDRARFESWQDGRQFEAAQASKTGGAR